MPWVCTMPHKAGRTLRLSRLSRHTTRQSMAEQPARRLAARAASQQQTTGRPADRGRTAGLRCLLAGLQNKTVSDCLRLRVYRLLECA
jgi:hypothetical protein